MQWLKNNIIAIICLIVLLFLLFKKDKTSFVTTKEIQRDSVFIVERGMIQELPTIKEIIHLPAEIWYSEIGKEQKPEADSMTANVYKQSFQMDSLGSSATITDTILKDAIIGRKFEFNLMKQQIINQTTTTIIGEHKRSIYGGLVLGNNVIGAGVLYQNKKNSIFGLNYGFNPSTSKPSFSISIHKKLW